MPLIYLKDIKYKYLDWIEEFIYAEQFDVEEPELVQLLSVGKDLGVNGILEQIINNDANITKEDDVSEVQSSENVENIPEQREVTSSDIIKEKGQRVITNCFHQENIGFSFNKCGTAYRSRLGLFQHIRSVHEERKYDCNQCDYIATRQDYLTTHIKIVHEGVKYVCSQCDYRATQQNSLTAHIKSVHEEVKYECNQCDHRASWKGDLTTHIQSVHEGVKYDCNQCDYKAAQQGSLTHHIQSVHKE